MTPEEFRSAGHELIDWLADLRTSVPDRPVLAQVDPGQVAGEFSAEPPQGTQSFGQLMAELDSVVVPGLTQTLHPMHFGWFPSNAALSSVLGDIACSGISALGISWESNPSLTEVEQVTCDWMRQLIGLSDQWEGSIQDTASTACLVSMLVARERASGLAQNTGGTQAITQPLVVYTTAQAHSSVAKAALLAGFGWDNVRKVETDPATYAMIPAALEQAIERDLAAGNKPAAIVAAVGTTGTTAIDPVAAIVAIAQRHDCFVHVDAAMAGSVMLLPEYRHLWDGIEGVDAISWNPHKWMGTILDCSLLYFRDIALVEEIMATNPSYLRSNADGAVPQLRDRGIPLGRRFRALKLLFHLRLDGIESIKNRLRRDLENAQWLLQRVEASEHWEVCAPVPLQTICVRHRPDGLSGPELDEHTLAWVGRINQSGAAYLTPSILDGEWMVRVSIGVEATEREHVEALWELMQSACNTR